MKKQIAALIAGTMITAMMTGCGVFGTSGTDTQQKGLSLPKIDPFVSVEKNRSASAPENTGTDRSDAGTTYSQDTTESYTCTNEEDNDSGYNYDPDAGYFYGESGKDRKSILPDPDDYEPGSSSPYYDETPTVRDSRFESAVLMYDYEGRVYSSDYADLAFTLTGVYGAGAEEIDVVFHKCQYTLSGIDLGAVYTGTLTKIDGSNYVNMDGYYIYEFPFMDLWEDGSRHPDTFYLKFSFGSNDTEFCVSKIGLLNDTMYMRSPDVTAETDLCMSGYTMEYEDPSYEEVYEAQPYEETYEESYEEYYEEPCEESYEEYCEEYYEEPCEESYEDTYETYSCDSIEDTLISWAADYYACRNGAYPEYCECVPQSDGIYALHLYDMVTADDGTMHTATVAWYWVDADGKGTNILGEAVDIHP